MGRDHNRRQSGAYVKDPEPVAYMLPDNGK